MNRVTSNKYINKAIITALEAGKAILDMYNTDFSVKYKTDNSPLTRADKEAHLVIGKRLLECEPVFPVLSEMVGN